MEKHGFKFEGFPPHCSGETAFLRFVRLYEEDSDKSDKKNSILQEINKLKRKIKSLEDKLEKWGEP